MNELWFRPFIWLDYRLAVVVMLILPLILLIWTLAQKSEAMHRLLLIYWRVASLWLITLYLMMPGWPMAYFTAFAARILIPLSLWFWVDLNDEIKDLPPSLLRLVTTSWRWAVTLYCCFGALLLIPFLSCGLGAGAGNVNFCQVWFLAPWSFKAWFHNQAAPGFLGFLGIVGLIIYVLYFLYFLVFRLGRQGRSALEQ
ncbi:MAG: DUF3177 family protein [Cyanobacteria bacterium RI_101]|nr:DUF3177 family protein [Cyanobacteria bacterium RI_101]